LDIIDATTPKRYKLKLTLSQGVFSREVVTISEQSTRAGLVPSRIRYSEKARLPQASPRANGRRVYREGAVHQFVIICFAKATGFALTEIRLLLHGFPQETTASTRWNNMARGKLAELESILRKAQAMKRVLESMMSCRRRRLQPCVQRLVRSEKKWRR